MYGMCGCVICCIMLQIVCLSCVSQDLIGVVNVCVCQSRVSFIQFGVCSFLLITVI